MITFLSLRSRAENFERVVPLALAADALIAQIFCH